MAGLVQLPMNRNILVQRDQLSAILSRIRSHFQQNVKNEPYIHKLIYNLT